MEYEVNRNAIGTYIRYLTGERETVKILGYEIRQNATCLIVENGRLDSKINILNEGKIFKFVE